MHRWIVPVLCFLAAPALNAQSSHATTLFAQPAASASFTLAFDKETVAVLGIPPRGRAVLFSVAHEAGRWSVRVVRRAELLEDTDGDGAVELALGSTVPRRSLWVAVDLTSAQRTAAAPADYLLREIEVPPGLFDLGGGVLPERLRDQRRAVELLVVRPAAGAWRITSGDGGPDDDDGEANGEIVTALDRLEPLGDTAAPLEALQPGDLVVMIDPDRLEFYAARFVAPPQ